MHKSVDNSVENVKNSVYSRFLKGKTSAKHSLFCEYSGKKVIYINFSAHFAALQEMVSLASFRSKISNIYCRMIDRPVRLW